MLTREQLDRLADARGERGVRLVVHTGADAELGVALADVARQVVDAKVAVAVDHGDGSGLAVTPALAVGDNAIWSAAPDGPEADPFAEHLAALLDGAELPSWTGPLADVSEPAELMVFIAPTCPHCPNAVRVALAAARASAQVRVVVVDVQRHEELARTLKVTAVPLTVLDGGLSITGVPDGAELVARIVERGGQSHSAQLFASLLENARLDEAGEVAAREPAVFVAAWKVSTTSSRMGLMLVAEQLLERDPRCFDGLVADLLPATEVEDAALRGDTADLLGQIGEPSARPALERLLEDENPDVAEIARDALDDLHS